MIRIYEIAASSVLTPPAGRARIFLDSADNLIKARLDDGSLIVLSVTPEYIQDIVGSFFGDSSTINFTYDDNGNVASMDVIMSALDISQIPNVPSGNLTATNVQAALNELQSSIDQVNSDLTQEISDRQAADTNLQNQINNIIATDTENAQDAAAAAFAAGTQDGVSVTYNDPSNSFDVTNTDKGSVARAAHEAALDPHPQYQTAAESQAQVDAHANLTNNPHNVTKAQVGLGNADNTSDADKPVSTAQQAALDLKVDENAPITPGTKTKITYDSKGLVTAGEDAVLDDLADVEIDDPQIDEILSYNGVAWVNRANDVRTSAGAGVTYFLTNVPSPVSGYDFISKTPANEAEVDESVTVTNSSQLIEEFISDGILGTTVIDAGIWEFNYFTYLSSNSGVTFIRTEIYKRSASNVETLLFSVDSEEINHTVVSPLPTVSTVQPAFPCAVDDSLVLKVYAVTNSVTPVVVHLVHSGSTNYSHFHTPLITKHNDLAGLQGGSTNEYYHLTQTQNSQLVGGGNTALHFHSSDRDRSNHTGTQLAATISDFAASVRSTLLTGISFATNAAILATDSVLVAFGKLQAQINGHFGVGGSTHPDATPSVSGFMSSSDKTKLDGIQAGATANSTDAQLRDRATHTGTQLAATISDFTEASQDASASMLTSATHDGVSVNYNDVANSLAITNTDKGTTARAAHEAAIDPHPQYETAVEAQAKVDAHANLTNNPHNVTKAQVGLGNVQNVDTTIAANIANVPAGNIAATNVQQAINELDLEKQPLDGDLTAVSNLTGTGLVTRTAASTMTTRSIQAAAGETTVSNGDGVSGNPTIGLPDLGTASSVGAANSTISITTDAKGRVTAKSVQLISIVSSQVTDFATSVLGTLLTGFTVGSNTALAAADSILVAFGKVQGQLNALFNRNINTGTGLQGGGNLTADRTLSLTNTGVAAATYGSDGLNVGQFTVDAQGRLTSAQNTPITFGRHYQVFEDTVQSTSNSGAQPLTAVASSFTTSTLTAGGYLLVIQYYWTSNSGAADARFQVFVDGVAIGNQHNEELQDTSTNQIDQIIEPLTLTAGTHTIELRFGGEGGSTTTINRVTCQIWRTA